MLEDGSFTFTCSGLDSVERVRTGRISTAELAAVLEDAQDLGFFDLEGAYSMGHSDGIAEIVEIRHGGREKHITNYWIGGTREWLREFDPDIDLSRYDIHRGLSDLALRIDSAIGRRELLAELIALEQR